MPIDQVKDEGKPKATGSAEDVKKNFFLLLQMDR
jgi:hypothetical protein